MLSRYARSVNELVGGIEKLAQNSFETAKVLIKSIDQKPCSSERQGTRTSRLQDADPFSQSRSVLVHRHEFSKGGDRFTSRPPMIQLPKKMPVLSLSFVTLSRKRLRRICYSSNFSDLSTSKHSCEAFLYCNL